MNIFISVLKKKIYLLINIYKLIYGKFKNEKKYILCGKFMYLWSNVSYILKCIYVCVYVDINLVVRVKLNWCLN